MRTLGPMNGLPGYPGGSPFRQRASATKTLPRLLSGGGGVLGPALFAQNQSSSLYLSEWHGAVSDEFANPLREYGYPSDYGLPVTAESSSLTVNPMSDYADQSDIGSRGVHQLNMSHSSGSSTTLSPLRSGAGGHLSSSGLGDTSTASGG